MSEIEIEFYENGKDVLLIFTGIGGTTKGFQNKYEKIANQVINEHNFSVAIATTPSNTWISAQNNLQYVINFIFEKTQNKDTKIYVMGFSAGANIVLYYSYLFSQIRKVLAINPVMNVNFHWIDNGIKHFTGNKIIVVCGDKDPSFKWLGLLPKKENLDKIILQNTDHQFTNNIETFIHLPNKYLFNDNDD